MHTCSFNIFLYGKRVTFQKVSAQLLREYTDIVMEYNTFQNTLSPTPKILTNNNTKLNIHYFTQ